MKRDMDLIRTLLLKIEEMDIRAGSVIGIQWGDDFFEIPGYDREIAIRHFQLLMGARFIDTPSPGQGTTMFVLCGLSWEGHEFIDSIRSPEVWKRTTAGMKAVGGFGLDLIVQVAKAEGKRLITEKLGIPL